MRPVLLLLLAASAALPQPLTAQTLFFCEYVEGSSFNKAVEIYNPTGAPVDLSAYTLELYSNGSATASQTLALSGTLAPGDVFVATHPSADALLLAEADVTSGTVVNFNGDDAVALRLAGALVDVIGQIGFDPGIAVGHRDLSSTQDNTLSRMGVRLHGRHRRIGRLRPRGRVRGFCAEHLRRHRQPHRLHDCAAVALLLASTSRVRA